MQTNPKTSDSRTAQIQRVADHLEKAPATLTDYIGKRPATLSIAITPEKLLRLPAVMAIVGLQKSSIYDGQKNGTFPPSIKISRRAVCWTESSITAWVNERIQNARKSQG
jgi:prophage regulatory protein